MNDQEAAPHTSIAICGVEHGTEKRKRHCFSTMEILRATMITHQGPRAGNRSQDHVNGVAWSRC